MQRNLTLALCLLAISTSVAADEFSDALKSMCKNIQQCSMQQISNMPNVTPEMKEMMAATFEKSCASIQDSYTAKIKSYPDNYKDALACIKSMAEADCEILLDESKKSKACAELEAKSGG